MGFLKKTLVSLKRWFTQELLPAGTTRLIQDLEFSIKVAEARAQAAMIVAGQEHEKFKALRAQVCNLRVSQATHPRTGWEVMAYIPQEVVKRMAQEEHIRLYVENTVVRGLVQFAIKGILNMQANGKVNALVFEPLNMNGPARAPRWVQALYEREDGSFHMSDKAHLIDPGTEEQRVRKACGL